jgi:rod shape-determining protein MreC
MKTKFITTAVFILFILTLLPKNDSRIISNSILEIVNPAKQNYQNFIKKIKDKSSSYVFQKESINRLSIENNILRKQLLEQMHYIEEVKNIYSILPDLDTMPVSNVDIVETISYSKLNSYSQIILTQPKSLVEDKVYGLLQGKIAVGTAKLYNNQLIGSLISNNQCRFSVSVGEDKAPGIALGLENNKMIVKFIPKWYKIKEGDKVFTSGLDNIFFANIFVGTITKVAVKSSYSVAYIRTEADTLNPKAFFMINDATPTLAHDFDSTSTVVKVKPVPIPEPVEIAKAEPIIIPDVIKPAEDPVTTATTIPDPVEKIQIDQTQDDVVEPQMTAEVAPVVKRKRYKKKRKAKAIKKRAAKASSLDLF